MKNVMQKIREFLRDESGLTMTEYAVAGGLIVMGGVAAFQALGGNIATVINAVATEVASAATPAAAP